MLFMATLFRTCSTKQSSPMMMKASFRAGSTDPPSFLATGALTLFFADSGTPSHGFADIDKHEDVFNGGGGIDHVSYHQSADGVVVDMDYFGLGGGMAHRQGQSAYVDNPYFG